MHEPYNQLKIDQHASIPLASQLANQLKWLVASGQIGADEQLPAIRELADRLGINMHTVRAAYRQLEQSGLASVRQGSGTIVLGYERAQLARGSSNVPTFTIGVLIPSYSDFYTPFLDAIEATAEQAPLMFLVCNTQESAERTARLLDQLLSKGVDGILIASRGLPPELTRQQSWRLADGFPPVVFVDIPDAPDPRLLLDHAAGGRLAAEHLLHHGYTQPTIVTPPLVWANVAEVHQGFSAAYAEAGHPLDPERVVQVENFGLQSGIKAADQLLANGEPPSALFCNGDFLATGAMRRLTQAGLHVPDDVALLSYGDQLVSGLVEPPLTTVALDAAAMGAQAMQQLRRRMAGERVEAEVRLPISLTIRQSCGCGH